MARLIVHADDFGISPGANEAILDSHRRGVLTSTSVMANMPGFDDAVRRRVDAPDLGFGAHVSLNLGRPISPSPQVDRMLDRDGYLNASYVFHWRRSGDPRYLEQVRREADAQIRHLEDHGFVLDHLNSQSHVHMIPGIYRVFVDLAREHGIPHLRRTAEPWRGHPGWGGPANLAKCALIGAFATRNPPAGPQIGFIGLRHTGTMSEDVLLHHFDRLPDGDWELLTHPGTGDLADTNGYQALASDYLRLPARRVEWDALLSQRVRDRIDARGHTTLRFSDIR